MGEGHVGGMSADQAVGMVAAPPRQIPGRGMLIRRSEEVRTAAQHVDRWRRCAVEQVDVGDHQRAAAF